MSSCPGCSWDSSARTFRARNSCEKRPRTLRSAARMLRNGFLLADRQERCIATCGRGVDRERALAGEAEQVVRAAGLRTGAGQTFAAERLHTDHRTDLVAVDVAVADARAALDV